MTILSSFVLPSDIVIVPVEQLDPDVRARVACEPDDFYVTRPRSRTVSSIVDTRTAGLLQRFRQPTTIVDAVIAFSLAERRRPDEALDEAMMVLGPFINDGLLVPAGSELARPIVASLTEGARIGAFEVVRPVHVLVDTEVYLARTSAGSLVAVKTARQAAGARVRAALAHEAAVLGRLGGRVTPELLAFGERDGNPFLAMSWCAGVDGHHAAMETSGLGEAGVYERLRLAERTIDAYAVLHGKDVLHGDVHPRNLLVGPDGSVTVIDFGMAVPVGETDAVPPLRGGIDLYMAPEAAEARLSRVAEPSLTAAAEQYSVGALVYLLVTGTHTHEFSLVPEEMWRQLSEQPPLPFTSRGLRGLPAADRSIRRALSRNPQARYRSVTRWGRAFQDATTRDLRARPAVADRRPAAGMRQILDDVLARVAAPGALFHQGLPPPAASAMNGAAGVAYALLRISRARHDAALLAQADLWSLRAAEAITRPEALWNAEVSITPAVVGETSFYHCAPGVHAVQALVAHARGDAPAQRLAVDAFALACGRRRPQIDVAFGRSGLLLGCALLLDVETDGGDVSPVVPLGATLLDSIWRDLDHRQSAEDSGAVLGAAHGEAGILFAILRWCEASRTTPPPGFEERLSRLAAQGVPAGRGRYWPVRSGDALTDPALAVSWCNGSAGYVPLWALAHRHFDDERFLRLAQSAAWASWEHASGGSSHLCCGLGGRAYALLTLHRHTGEASWLARARELASRTADAHQPASRLQNSLYHGDVGIAALAAELETPDFAGMPLFDGEGWPRGAG